ncbi:MAG: T9SS type A sorting domain-containing protein [Bacteroidetes bacterium]|nr:T9SS type A sorting domain-containing protein [Bacteroidota bacterium]
MKKISLFFLFISLSIFVNAQNDQTNLDKYWHYRYRLVNDFMVVGDGPGMSLPACIRNKGGTQNLYWGETPVYLGYYLGVLATEYRLLKDNGQNTDRTLTELYYALKASVRIDFVAESYIAWNQSNVVDGFLIRDDVPANFVTQHSNELNQNRVSTDPAFEIGSGRPGPVSVTESDYSHFLNDPDPSKVAVSQDVIYQLLMGFALVKRYTDDGVLTFNNYVTGTTDNADLKAMAVDEADKIVSFIKENHGHHWVIHDPNDNAVVGGSNLDMAAQSYGLALSGTYITGITYNDSHTDPSLWQGLQDPNVLLCDPISNQASVHPMGMVLAAMSNSWRNTVGNNTTPDKILENGDYDAGGTFGCAYFDNHFGWDVFYGMLWDGFYGGQMHIGDLCKARDILNSAFADGPFDHNVADKAYPGWCATRRFFDDSPRQNIGKPGFEGNYNGLDYMLLFNLYYLDSKAQGAPIFIPQQSDPFISDHYPYFDPAIQEETGDISDPVTIFSPYFPVIANSLSVNSPQYTESGYLIIFGGPQGVLLTNTTVENYASLTVFNNELNTTCVPLQDYFFDECSYQRIINPDYSSSNGNEYLPSYAPTDEFKLYPNPSSMSINLNFPVSETSNPLVQIFNAEGKIVYESKNIFSQNNAIDVSTFTPGQYLIRVIDDEKVYTKKFLKE